MKTMRSLILFFCFLAGCAAPVMPAATASPENTPTVTKTETPVPTPTKQQFKCNLIPTPEAAGEMDIFTASQRLNRTINLGEALEFPDEGNWRWINKEDTFYAVKTAGFNAVRIPIEFAFHAEPNPPYTIPQTYWADFDSVVEKALACQLIVIINMHNFNGESQIPYDQGERFTGLWNVIAEHYKNYPDNVLYFEPYNEPGDPDFWNELLGNAITVIRKSNPTRPIIADAGDWSQISGLSKLRLPDDPNLIVSFHYYTPHEFTHQCVNFIEGAIDWCGTKWENTAEAAALINQDFDVVSQWGTAQQRPVFMGEFGSISAADLESRVKWTAAVREAAVAYGFSWGYWDLCDTTVNGDRYTFGLFDCYTYPSDPTKWNQEMLRALIPGS
jgi:endoglucanase